MYVTYMQYICNIYVTYICYIYVYNYLNVQICEMYVDIYILHTANFSLNA